MERVSISRLGILVMIGMLCFSTLCLPQPLFAAGPCSSEREALKRAEEESKHTGPCVFVLN